MESEASHTDARDDDPLTEAKRLLAIQQSIAGHIAGAESRTQLLEWVLETIGEGLVPGEERGTREGASLRAVSFVLTLRYSGPSGARVEHERFEELAAALDALERRADGLAGDARRRTVDLGVRQFEPVQQVAARVEVPDHSKRFWRLVERHFPGYREQERWLRRYGSALVLDT